MAHQSHKLPWNTLSSNFKSTSGLHTYGYRANLVPIGDPQQGGKIEHFAKVFARLLTGYATSNQQDAKLPDPEPRARPSERIASQESIHAMRTTLHYAHNLSTSHWCGICCKLHHYGFGPDRGNCICDRIYTDPCVLGYWLNIMRCPDCCARFGYGGMLGVISATLLHDQMEPLLRLASHPEIDLEKFFDYPWEFGATSKEGWAEVFHAALYPYIALNILYLHPDTWPVYQQEREISTEQAAASLVDYRLTAVYQRALLRCTATQGGDVQTLPHRLFFGISQGALKAERSDFYSDEVLVGQFPLEKLYSKEARGKYTIGPTDVDEVHTILRSMKLPAELINEIVVLAEYKPTSRLAVPDDPLHPSNADELRKYLGYCWRLLVRCERLANACGYAIDWEDEVKDCIHQCLFNYPRYPRSAVWRDPVDKPEGRWPWTRCCNTWQFV